MDNIAQKVLKWCNVIVIMREVHYYLFLLFLHSLKSVAIHAPSREQCCSA